MNSTAIRRATRLALASAALAATGVLVGAAPSYAGPGPVGPAQIAQPQFDPDPDPDPKVNPGIQPGPADLVAEQDPCQNDCPVPPVDPADQEDDGDEPADEPQPPADEPQPPADGPVEDTGPVEDAGSVEDAGPVEDAEGAEPGVEDLQDASVFGAANSGDGPGDLPLLIGLNAAMVLAASGLTWRYLAARGRS